MRDSLGMVVPVWYAPDMPAERMRELLTHTLGDCELFLRPEHIVLVVDGCPQAEAPARHAAAEFAARAGSEPLVVVQPGNEGQGGAVCRGFEHLLRESRVRYLCARDADGDHDIYDLPQLFRLLVQMEEIEGHDRVAVLGQRGDLHRPMGFARGQYEALLNEITLRAVGWAMAQRGQCPDLRYCRRLPGPPDFQSGYKLYTRATAEAFVSALRTAESAQPDQQVLRWGIQFVSTVELLLAGTVFGSVYRLTYDEQPQTSFEHADNRLLAYGRQFVWLYRRLTVPMDLGLRWWDEAILAVHWATVPGGWQELLHIRDYLARECWPQTAAPPPPRRHLMF
ncbi:MAG: hypothetical protein HPY69_01680 [Armatimonadetes bacterium]|nr:hypothetical protein [Armatimonadota bacterium]